MTSLAGRPYCIKNLWMMSSPEQNVLSKATVLLQKKLHAFILIIFPQFSAAIGSMPICLERSKFKSIFAIRSTIGYPSVGWNIYICFTVIFKTQNAYYLSKKCPQKLECRFLKDTTIEAMFEHVNSSSTYFYTVGPNC